MREKPQKSPGGSDAEAVVRTTNVRETDDGLNRTKLYSRDYPAKPAKEMCLQLLLPLIGAVKRPLVGRVP